MQKLMGGKKKLYESVPFVQSWIFMVTLMFPGVQEAVPKAILT